MDACSICFLEYEEGSFFQHKCCGTILCKRCTLKWARQCKAQQRQLTCPECRTYLTSNNVNDLKNCCAPMPRRRCPEPAEDITEAPPQKTKASAWKKFRDLDGSGDWWWREVDGAWFLENAPGPWKIFRDPETLRDYRWKSDADWFWA